MYGHSHRKKSRMLSWLICVKNRDAAIDARNVECRAEIRSMDKGPSPPFYKNHYNNYPYKF